MLNLEKVERRVIILLGAALLLGLSVLAYKRSHPCPDIRLRAFDVGSQNSKFEEGYPAAREKIDINTSGAEGLMKLRGIGKVLADRIIAYRSSNGPFSALEDIKKIKGIGEALFDKIKDEITTG